MGLWDLQLKSSKQLISLSRVANTRLLRLYGIEPLGCTLAAVGRGESGERILEWLVLEVLSQRTIQATLSRTKYLDVLTLAVCDIKVSLASCFPMSAYGT